MKMTSEIDLASFDAWSGAESTKEAIINAKKEKHFNNLIEELYPDGISETTLNDILWHDSEWLYNTLRIDDEFRL